MTDDDPLTSWHDRIGSLRKRGRISIASLSIAAPSDTDARFSRPSPPARLTSIEERELWEQLILSRRPGWFAGAEAMLESYIVTVVQVQRFEAELRKAEFNTPAYKQLLRLHHKTVALASSLAIRLRLVPSSRLDKNQPHDGDNPVA